MDSSKTVDEQAAFKAISFQAANGFTIPRLDQYFGLWLIEPDRFSQLVSHAKRIDLVAHVQEAQQAEMRSSSEFGGPRSSDDIAFFNVGGPMMKFASSLSDSTGTVALRRQLRSAARDDSIRAGVIRIDSPGGTFAGQGDLIREIENFKSRKPLWTFAEDIAASAAYWVFANGDRSYATPETSLGSIGTFSALYDESGAYEAEGIKVHTFTTGPLKGQGLPGSKPSEEYLAYRQEMVEQANEFFLDGIASARSMSREKLAEIATGQVFFAAKARELGLTDEVGTYEEMMTELRASLRSSEKASVRVEENFRVQQEEEAPPCDTLQTSGEEVADDTHEEESLLEEQTTMAAATLSELKQAIPSASPDFLVDALDKELSIEDAKGEWCKKLEADNAKLAADAEAARQASAAELEAVKQENESLKSAAKKPGVKQGIDTGINGDDGLPAIDQINSLVATRMAATGEERGVAWSKVCQKNPELRERMVAEANS